jgi:hypothetical protein
MHFRPDQVQIESSRRPGQGCSPLSTGMLIRQARGRPFAVHFRLHRPESGCLREVEYQRNINLLQSEDWETCFQALRDYGYRWEKDEEEKKFFM